MSDGHVKYLLIGGGAASYSAAAAIRTRDPDGIIGLVGQEINRPYYRTGLSKGYLRRQMNRSALFTAEPSWFSNHGVHLRTGCRAAHLDTGRAIVTLDSGQAVSYDRLLIATGAIPRHLNITGGNLPNIFNPRTLDDYEQLHTAIEKSKTEGRKRGLACVVGGGLLGVEIAASLAQSGLTVDLVVSTRHPWMKFAGEATGQFMAHFLIRHGVRLHESVRAGRIEGDGRAQRVVLSDGRMLDCDFVIAAIGAIPNKEILRGTPIVAEQAIRADEHCRTSEANVFAAGDCAAVLDPIFGKHRAAEPWDTAAETGRIAGINMAGGNESFSAVTSFETEVFGLKSKAWGQSKHVDRRVLRGAANVDQPDFLEIGIDGEGRISQILAVGHAVDESVLENLVRRRVSVEGKEEMLKDPAAGLAGLV